MELEETPGDEQVSLVSVLEGTDIEVVMEATGVTFAAVMPDYAGWHSTARSAPSSKRSAEQPTWHLSCLPWLEPYLPPPGTIQEAVIVESTDSGIHVALQPEPTDLPLGLTAFCATAMFRSPCVKAAWASELRSGSEREPNTTNAPRH